MKILFLTQYFPPEIGAPQNRLYELAIRLEKKGIDITVLTAMPNYPQMEIHEKYKSKLYFYEEENNLKIHRAYIYVSKSKSLYKRLLNYFSFVFTSFFIGLFKLNKFDFVFCESPPLFLGISAFLLSKAKRSKLIFNVSDLWPESAEKLGLFTNKFVLKRCTEMEEFFYKKSALITGQTQGIVNNISSRFPKKKTYWLPNGVDLSYYNYKNYSNSWRESNNYLPSDFILLYAGILGYAQGLEVILNAAQLLKENSEIKFIILGSGPEKERLMKLKEELNLNNIMFLDPVSKNKMPEIVASSNASIIPLKRIDLFKGAIPSKIFENLAMKKPILLGVEGEAKELFIDKGECGLAFIPEDQSDLAKQILNLYSDPNLYLQLSENALNYVSQNFSRDRIADNFYNVLKEVQ